MSKDIDLKRWSFLIAGIIAVYWGVNNFSIIERLFGKLLNALFPFILGCFLAFVLNIAMTKIENFLKKFIKNNGTLVRVLSISLSLIMLILILGIVAFLLVPELVENIEMLIQNIPVVVEKVEIWVLDLLDKYPDLQLEMAKFFSETGDISNKVAELLNYFINGIVGFISKVISSLVTVFMSLVFAIYILSQKEYLKRGSKKFLYAYINKKQADKVMDLADLSNITFSKFISGQCLEAVILGCILFVVLSIFRFPYALIISVLTAVTALVPIFGAVFAMVVGVILIAIVNPFQALMFIIVFQIVQQIEGNFIYPKVVGKSVGLSPLWTLLSITVGGSLFGIIGMLIGLPIASIIYAFIQSDVNRKIKSKKINI